MKTTKRIFACLLIVVMLASMLCVGASAAVFTPMADTGTVTINGAAAGTTYTFYRVFDLASTNGTDKHVYITNSLWDSISATVNAGDAYATIDSENMVADWKVNSTANAIAFADDVITAIPDIAVHPTTIKAVTVSASGDFDVSGLQYGYYVMKSSRDDKTTVFTLAKSTLTIEEKNTNLPLIDQKVNAKDADTVGSDAVFTYTTTVTAAAGTDTYTVTDTLPAGIVYTTGSLKVKDKNSNDLTEGTHYTVNVDGQKITVVFSDTYRAGLNDNDKTTITYTASLTDSVVAGAKYTNNTVLTYEKSATEPKTADSDVYTSQIQFNKYKNTASGAHTTDYLAGAKFKLSNGTKYAVLTNAGDVYTVTGWDATGTEITTDAATITIKYLAAGSYTLTETYAPTGYVGATDTPIAINSTETAGVITAIDVPPVADIYNTPGNKLPETGGMGTTVFYAAGGILVLGALVVLLMKKRTVTE